MGATPRWDVLFLLLQGSLILDWAGPAEALRMANVAMVAQGKPAPFHLRFISPQPQAVSSVGVSVCGLEALPSALTRPSWLVLLGQPGERMVLDDSASQAALRWLTQITLKTGQLELLTICAGAVLAAHAGLLTGRQVTTHHQHLEELAAAAPACQVVRNRVFVDDAPLFSSAGVSTGIDLMLYRMAQVCGAAVAAHVAQTLVVAMRRGPHDPELSPFLSHRNHLHPALHRVQDAVSLQPTQDWHLSSMASIACTSSRHLTRIFMTQAGIAPLQYLRQLRLHLAQTALKSGRNVTQAAALAGFSSDTQLRRAWHQAGLPGSPSQPESS